MLLHRAPKKKKKKKKNSTFRLLKTERNNMKSWLIVLTMFVNLMGCKSSSRSIVGDHQKSRTTKPEGHWTLEKIEIIKEKQSVEKYIQSAQPDDPREEFVPVYMDEKGVVKPLLDTYLSRPMNDLVFIGDSIAWMNYPLQMEALRFYSIESDLLKIENDNSQKSIVLSADQNTLRISYLDHYGLFLEETYKRTTFNDSILKILTLYKINIPELAGTWELIRVEGHNDGSEYQLDFPHDIADTLVLKKEELESTFFLDKSCQILTDGKKRKYFINYKDGELLLTPDTWYSPTEWLQKGRSVDKLLRFYNIKWEE